jgi:hypothetical protein
MFLECRLLHEEQDELNRFVVNDMYVIIVAKVVSISGTIVTLFTGSQIVDAHRVGQFVPPLECSVG